MLRKVLAGTGCLVLHASVVGGAAAWAAPVRSPMADTCGEVLSGDPGDVARKATDPADGTWVSPGHPVAVSITWPADAFAGTELHKVLDCVTINNELAPELSREERRSANDGSFGHSFAIPADLPVGTEICDRGMVAGPGADRTFRREKTNDVCFIIAGPAPGQRGPGGVPDPGPQTKPPLEQPGVVEAPAPAAAPQLPQAAPALDPVLPAPGLARTGTAARFLAAFAGLQLVLGGISVIFGAARRRRSN